MTGPGMFNRHGCVQTDMSPWAARPLTRTTFEHSQVRSDFEILQSISCNNT